MFRPTILIASLWLLFVSSLSANETVSKTAQKRIQINYGSVSSIVFDPNTKTYSVLSGQKIIIADAYATVKNNAVLISSKDYDKSSFVEAAITDGFGKGNKYTITLTKSGMPDMEQVFYVYPGHDYFFTEVNLKGAKLKTNMMAPLVSSHVDIGLKGDYRTLFVPFDNDTFIRYDAKSTASMTENTSAEVTAVYENQSRKGLVLGSVEHMVWKTGIQSKGKAGVLTDLRIWGGYTDEKVTRDKTEHGYLTGAVVKSPKLFVGYFADWRTGLEAYGKANRIQDKPYVFNWTKPVPFGWNSWGVIQEKLSYEKALKVVDFFATELPAFRNGQTAYIDLDSFWDNFTGGMRGDYSKLKQFADYCKSKGLEPGVYWAPFTDWGFKSKNQREAEGSRYLFSEMWTKVGNGYHDFDGARALDPTHPGTKKRIDYIVDKLKACGFKMIKVDFLGHAAAESDAYYDKNVTTGMQAYRMGMEYLVDRLDGQMLIYAAISPSLATGRYAHMRRIACDAWKTIKDTEYTLNSLNYGWWQTYVYNFLDADHVVFGTESEGANRARITSALITGTFIAGDDYSAEGPWQQAAKKWLQDQELLKAGSFGVAFMPVDGNSGDKANELFVRKNNGFLYVAVLNYKANAKTFNIPLERLGLTKTTYEGTELFGHQKLNIRKFLNLTLAATDAALLKIKI